MSFMRVWQILLLQFLAYLVLGLAMKGTIGPRSTHPPDFLLVFLSWFMISASGIGGVLSVRRNPRLLVILLFLPVIWLSLFGFFFGVLVALDRGLLNLGLGMKETMGQGLVAVSVLGTIAFAVWGWRRWRIQCVVYPGRGWNLI